ncbi:hypothetical protein KFO32_06000 [Pantoea ananatis]|uniref:hypothetical protein n=1 Tax=Pantoea ananas TaxID=553 RepID=UPI001FF23360|nr:hypothetical protein [Pantoea ananatis]MCK0552629.1 hypothetical protein [Pantoea ananatis]
MLEKCKAGIASLWRDKISLASVIVSLIFMCFFFHLRLNDKSEQIAYWNAGYCSIAVIALMVDRFWKGFLSEEQSKTLAFAFTVTPIGNALVDVLFYTPTWKNSYLAGLFLIALAWLAVWVAMYTLIYNWPSKSKATQRTNK